MCNANPSRPRRAGFTLLEVMIVVGILGTIMGMVASVLVSGGKTVQAIDLAGDLQETADRVVNELAKQVRGSNVTTPSVAGVAGNQLVFQPLTQKVLTDASGYVVPDASGRPQFVPDYTVNGAGVLSYNPAPAITVSVSGATASATGTLQCTDISWDTHYNYVTSGGHTTATRSAIAGTFAKDVPLNWAGPTIANFGYTGCSVANNASTLGFFAYRINDSGGQPNVLVIGLSLQATRTDGAVIKRCAIRQINLGP